MKLNNWSTVKRGISVVGAKSKEGRSSEGLMLLHLGWTWGRQDWERVASVITRFTKVFWSEVLSDVVD